MVTNLAAIGAALALLFAGLRWLFGVEYVEASNARD